MKFALAWLGLAGLLALGACSASGEVFGLDAAATDATAGSADAEPAPPDVGQVDTVLEPDAAPLDAPAAEAAPDTRYGDSMVALPSHPSCAFGRQPLKHVPPELML